MALEACVLVTAGTAQQSERVNYTFMSKRLAFFMSATVFGIIFYQLFDGYSSFSHLVIVIILAAVMGSVFAASIAGKK